ncbi:MAG: restriction endonuclease subunit S [Chlorobium sp.]|nr:MAG: restriction endonuclease subunit S [Chlorobium sp.]
MKAGWAMKRLNEVCQIKPPKAEARKRISTDTLVSFVPMEDLGIEQKFFNAVQKKPLSVVSGSYTYFADGDVLLAKITPCFENGKLGIAGALTNGIGFGSSEYIVFRSDGRLRNEWLYYYLSRESFRVEGAKLMSGAVGHKRVPKEFIENYLIPVPPLPEQQRIVALLDEAFAAIATAKANAEKNLKNARALFDSYLNYDYGANAFLGDLVQIKTGKLDANAAEANGRYPFFTCSREVYSINNYAFDCEAILLAGNNAVGDFNVKHYKGRFNAYQRTYVITVNEKQLILYRFLYFHLLKSLKTFKEQSVGVGTKFLKLGMIQNLKIALPPLADQQQIVTKLDALSEETQLLESIYQKKITTLDALKKSILHQAFTGEL